MPSLKSLRLRIKSIKSTQKITKAMQTVASVKVKKYQKLLLGANKYSDTVDTLLFNLMNNSEVKTTKFQKFLFPKESYSDTLLVFISSERGLCGSLNSNIMKKLRFDIMSLNNPRIIVIGKKGYELLKSQYPQLIYKYYNNHDHIELTNKLKEEILNDDSFDNLQLYYTRFRNAISYIPSFNQIFPFNLEKNTDSPSYEIEGKCTTDKLIELYLETQIALALLQSKTSEEGSRMISMDNATKNATDMVNLLTLKLNMTRQTIITKELIEIVSGAEAL